MATGTVDEEFITIVPVGENRPPVCDPTFVTVLTVGAAPGAAEVVILRPRGARLGLGLKFEGGSAAAEKVRRLLVQSCAEDSPAANACTPWGKLIPGDEILAIDGTSVSELTRIDCVRKLKDSDEKLTLLVRHFESDNHLEDKSMDETDNVSANNPSDIQRPITLPPPVPPRKLGKKNSFKDKQTLQTVGEQNSVVSTEGQVLNGKGTNLNEKHNGYSTITKLSRKSSFDSHIHRKNKESIACLRKGSPEEVRRLVRRLSDGKTMPPEAEVYIDLLSTEWERCLLLADGESDDTGSSISTVVDRLSSMASSVDNSIPSTPIMQPKTIDIQKVLNCIENIDSNILKDITSSNFIDKQKEVNNIVKAEKEHSNDVLLSKDNTNQNKTTADFTKKLQQNDKNNNNTFVQNLSCNKEINPSENEILNMKTEVFVEKPKPLPRTMKVERSHSEKKPRTFSIPATPPPPIPEPLLTPTKKNCIETWLQRSEAEMKNTAVEKLEECVGSEALPRLIDFVPKPQFKECNNDTPPLQRPTSAPPPPPAETREDGSGASLDTIGELDESSDINDNRKPVVNKNETTNRKSSYQKSFWEDRCNKSDAEDKSLSNDETPLPNCPRQPPDGVETPSDSVEKAPATDLPNHLPPRLSAGWPSTRSRFSYLSRTQDARSEASVKDKIAMFSNDHAISSERLDKCDTMGTKNSNTRKSTATNMMNYSEITSLDRRLTKSQDNLDDAPRSYKRYNMDRPEAQGSRQPETTSTYEGIAKSNSFQSESKPLFYASTTTLPARLDTAFVQSKYHVRTVSDDNGNKNQHKSNLEYLIEQRKKSMSKLKGLVIPEIQGPIIDLPEIKVQDPPVQSFFSDVKVDKKFTNKENKISNCKPITFMENKWKSNLLTTNIPKYSPAFKRKSLQVYIPSLSKESTPERKFSEKNDLYSRNSTNPSTLRKTTQEFKNGSGISVSSTLPAKFSTPYVSHDYKGVMNNFRDYKNVEIKICTATEVVDSDNDSAMSSTQSSYRSSASSPLHNLDIIESDSSRVSPRTSHYATYSVVKSETPSKLSITAKSCDEFMKRGVCRSMSSDTNVSLSSSAGSAATSGSQASCSSLESSVADSDKKKVSKSYNIDTINRRNILASAKCRSGRDAKVKSPVIETKFSHKSNDGNSLSPTPPKASDRLSTLTASVSAVSNKGDSRRRNKVIAETDSDSDSEINLRQRKSDFKNTRLKRNSSSNNKSKQNDNNSGSPKSEDPPRVITEKIMKEIKKAGLDNYVSNKKSQIQEKRTIDIIMKSDSTIKGKDEALIVKHDVVDKDSIVPKQKQIDVVDNAYLVDTLNTSNGKNIPKKFLNADANGLQREATVSSQIIRLRRGVSTGVGLILAGGIDCEAKDVTVHRVLENSIAAKAGLKRGSKVRSINGHSMTGLTHAQSVIILKEQRSEVVIEIADASDDNDGGTSCGSENAESKTPGGSDMDDDKVSSCLVTVVLEKAGGGAGLGFGLDGGRDSPLGDRPLTIKKLFAGGAAAQSGRVLVGAELISAGGQSMEGFTRTQAWAALKALPVGPVTLVLKNPTNTFFK